MAVTARAQTHYTFDAESLGPEWSTAGEKESGQSEPFVVIAPEAARTGTGGLMVGKRGSGSAWSSARLSLKQNLAHGSVSWQHYDRGSEYGFVIMSLLDASSNAVLNVNLPDARWDQFDGPTDAMALRSYVVESRVGDSSSIVRHGRRAKGWHAYAVSTGPTGTKFTIDDYVVLQTNAQVSIRYVDFTFWSVAPETQGTYFDDVILQENQAVILTPDAPLQSGARFSPRSSASRIHRPDTRTEATAGRVSPEAAEKPASQKDEPEDSPDEKYATDPCAISTPRMDMYHQILKRNPDNVLALHWRGFLYAMLGLGDCARADFEKAILLEPNDPAIRWSYGWALVNLDDYAEAARQWEKWIELDQSRERDSSHHLALAYWGAGNMGSALRLFDAAVQSNPHRWVSREHARRYTTDWTEKERDLLFSLYSAWRRTYPLRLNPEDYALPDPDKPVSER
jgi:hypothetical protein